MKDTKIEWCHHTLNLWHGCTEVSPGCDNCYARTLDNRWNGGHWNQQGPRKEIKSSFPLLTKIGMETIREKITRTVFTGSMMDIFEKPMPVVDSIGDIPGYSTDYLRQKYFKSIPLYPNLIHLLLTKRPGNIKKYIPKSWGDAPPENIMYGTSPVDANTAVTLIPELLKLKGRKFLSIEPMLGGFSLFNHMTITQKVDWIIVGGESGHGKRPFNPDWARSIMNECKALGIPFFMKQWDKIREIPDDLMVREFPAFFNQKNTYPS